MKAFAKSIGEWLIIRLIGGIAFAITIAVFVASFSWGFISNPF